MTPTHEAKWLEEQRCPQCGRDPENCDYCSTCCIELMCAQTPGGIGAATAGVDPDGTLVLILAAAGLH